MKYIVLYLSALFSLFGSCKAGERNPTITFYEIKKTGRIVVDKNIVQSSSPVCLKIFEFNGKTYLSYFDQTIAKIFIHQLEGDHLTFIDTVNTRPTFKKSYIMDYTLISLDSIVIAFNPSYTRENHDTSMCLINRRGQLLSSIDFSDLPVPTGRKIKQYGNDARNYYPYYLNFVGLPLSYNKQLKSVIGHFNCSWDICGYNNRNKGNSEFHAALLSFGGKNKQIQGLSFGLDTGLYYSLNVRYPTGTYNSNSGEMVFSFRYHNLWQVVDTTLAVRKINIESYIVDTIYPIKKFFDEYCDYSRGEFARIEFNKYTNQYYRFVRVSNNVFQFTANSDIKPTKKQGVETYLVQVVNSNYVLEGEAILPPQYSNGVLLPYNDKNVLLFNDWESSKMGSIVFDIVEFKPKKITLAAYKEKLKKRLHEDKLPEAERYTHYVAKIYDKKYANNVIIHVDKGCVGCKEFMFTYLKENITKVAGKDISITLITTNKKNLLNRLGDPVLPPNVFIDDVAIYKSEFPEIYYSTLLYRDSSNAPAIIKYESSNIGELYKVLEAYK